MRLVLLSLDKSKVEIASRFYARLGYDFVPEQHGPNGLAHVSTEIALIPVEIYPPMKNLLVGERFLINIEVTAPETPEALKSELIREYGGEELDTPIPTTRTGIATLRDPNRILVRLFPKVITLALE